MNPWTHPAFGFIIGLVAGLSFVGFLLASAVM